MHQPTRVVGIIIQSSRLLQNALPFLSLLCYNRILVMRPRSLAGLKRAASIPFSMYPLLSLKPAKYTIPPLYIHRVQPPQERA